MPEYRVSATLLYALASAEETVGRLRQISDAVVAGGTIREVHKDVHPWIEYNLPCEQYAQVMVRFDVFQEAQAALRNLLGVYTAIPGWYVPKTTEAQWELERYGAANRLATGMLKPGARRALKHQREEFNLKEDEWPDMQAARVFGQKRAILFRAWHDLTAQLVELALWATNIQPIFMFPGEAQRKPNPEGWFSSGLGCPQQVRSLLAFECQMRGAEFSYWQDNPGILGGSTSDSDRKSEFYQSFHLTTHGWFPGHPASAAVFAPFRRGVNVLKLVRGDRDGMVWEAAHWDELDRYQNLNYRAFPVHAYEAWYGPESMRPGQVVNWMGAYPTFMLDYVREQVQKKSPIPWEDGDHPLDGDGITPYTPYLSTLVVAKDGTAAEAPPTSRKKQRRRRFRRVMHWVFSPLTAMAQAIEENRDLAEPRATLVKTLEFIDSVPDETLEDIYWQTFALDGESLDDEWVEGWEDPRKYSLGAKLRDRQQDIRRAKELVPIVTMGPRMRLKWAAAWAEGVAYQDAVATFRDGMNAFFEGHIPFFEARGDLTLDASAREAMAVAKAQANGQKVTTAIGAVAGIAAAINPIAGAIVAVVAALVGLFTSLFGGSIRADNFRLAPQSPALRQPADPNACASAEAADAVANITAETDITAETASPSKLPYILAAAAAGVLGLAIFKKSKS